MELVKAILEHVQTMLENEDKRIILAHEIDIALRLLGGLAFYDAEKALSVIFCRKEDKGC